MYKVIVVDDEALVREAICKKLNWEKIGYELVGKFENGAKAKEFLQQHPVDVVLTDICMPYIDGMELTEYIYHNSPEVKVVIFSGFDEFEYAKKAIRFQVQEYLLKPVTSVELSELLIKLKEKMDSEREAKDETARLSKVVSKNKIYLESKALFQLLCGSESIDECMRELKETGIAVEGKQFAAAALHVWEDGKEAGKGNESSLFQFIRYNIVEEIVKERHLGWTVMGEHDHIFILFCGKAQPNKEFENEIRDCLVHISRAVKENTRAVLDIGIGKTVPVLENISFSYQMAEKCLDYIYVAGHDKILWAEEIRKKHKEETDMRLETENLTEAVKRYDSADIAKNLGRIQAKMSICYIEKAKAVVNLQMCVKSLYQCAEKYIELTGESEEMPVPVEEEVLLAIDQAGSLEESVHIIKKLAEEIAEKYQLGTCGSQKKIAVMAMEYLNENYGNQELTLTEVCSHFGISVSRFSANFKSRYDETFMEALTRIRMEKAKMLLCGTDLKNYEIAERVGFTDPHYFSIAFKKATGKTPTEWGREHVEG